VTDQIHRTTPIQDSIEHIPPYPENFFIYKVTASRFYQASARLDGIRAKKSLKTTSRAIAKTAATEFFDGLYSKKAQKIPLVESPNFGKVFEDLVKVDQRRVNGGKHKQSSVTDAQYIYKADLGKFFAKQMAIAGSWAELSRAVAVFPGECFDGYWAEGISDTLVRKMGQDWRGFVKELGRQPADGKLFPLVLKSLNATLDPDDLQRVIKLARNSCPVKMSMQCNSIIDRVKKALADYDPLISAEPSVCTRFSNSTSWQCGHARTLTFRKT
jgi:hypothetical protein